MGSTETADVKGAEKEQPGMGVSVVPAKHCLKHSTVLGSPTASVLVL